jgi:hypothetical protein
MFKFVMSLFLFFSGFSAGAGDNHSANVCSVINAEVCAHLGHMTSFSSKAEVQFVAHIMAPQNQQVSDTQIDLWMPDMGHGSSPLSVKQFGVNKYNVTKAYFVMSGLWLVRLKFSLAGEKHQIEIPVNIVD